ncbi:hypothetical protein HUE87_04960 [Candidatus Sulfurimonas marisnigri]|uniref:Uncharacterized protein n=1 Tax=Candidatus Sulfurimonas marisnigri TaxID=2740405 RepID=A0A7S7M1U2_9BACT|nr:hypothetical protein [Candidatus Sulfurimonas marisnigri]QOY55581.1 hypothetical protein HUE87_04960 [Candidatus Sulfurimonas marisnigri]
MKHFLKVFTFLLFSFGLIFANEFKEIKEISLKKDEQKKILVKYDDKEKLFEFRWTLYKNGGLVILRSYDTIVAQNVLYLRNQNKSFRLILKPRGSGFFTEPYVLVRFKEFNHDTGEAKFELLLSDGSGSIELKYLKNN